MAIRCLFAPWKVLQVTVFTLSFLLLSNVANAGCHVQAVRSIAPTDPSGGGGSGPITVDVAGVPADLNAEGLTERVSDVLIYDDNSLGTSNCFAVGNVLRLTYNAALTSPASITSATAANFDVYDSVGNVGLTIQASSNIGFASNAPQTVISINILQAGTAATSPGGITSTGNGVGSAVRIKNLRVDVTQLTVGSNVTATVSSVSTTALPAQTTVAVGVTHNTIAPGAGIIQAGFGTQSSGGTLDIPDIFAFGEGFGTAFRVGGTNVSGVAGDIPTGATSLIFDMGTTIPWGVKVTFPSTIETSAAAGTGGITFTRRSGGICTGPANCVAIYDTTANGLAVSNVTLTTALTPNTGANGALPAIGVFIPNPSGFGTATLAVSFGPGVSGGSNDDANATAIPRYLTNTTFTGPTRRILTYSLALGQAGGSGVITTAPSLLGLSPNTATAGTAGATLAVAGSNFAAGSVVLWNGSPRATTFVSSTELAATISAADLAAAGTATVTVSTGGVNSNAVPFSIVTNPLSSSPLTYLLPHLVSGGGYVTKITVVNTSNSPNAVVVNFLSQGGAILQSTSYNVAAGGTLRVSTPESERFGAAVTKWAMVGTQSPVLVNLFFEYKLAGSNAVENSVGFNDAPPLADFSVPVEFEPAPAGLAIGRTAGLALANGNTSPVTAVLKLVDSNGAVVATHTINLPALGQASVDLSQIAEFSNALPAVNFVGSVTVSASAPIAAIALADNYGPFSATPVGPGRAR